MVAKMFLCHDDVNSIPNSRWNSKGIAADIVNDEEEDYLHF